MLCKVQASEYYQSVAVRAVVGAGAADGGGPTCVPHWHTVGRDVRCPRTPRTPSMPLKDSDRTSSSRQISRINNSAS
jgi:hypothetical protein